MGLPLYRLSAAFQQPFKLTLLAATPPDEFADLIGTILGEPQIAGLIQRDIPWITATHHVRTILRDIPSPRIDLAEHTGVGLGKPQVAIGTSGDLCRLTVEGQPRMLHDRPGGRDGADLVASKFRKPQLAIGTRRNPLRLTVVCFKAMLGDHTSWCNLADAVAIQLRKPQVIIRPFRDPFR